MNQLKKIIALFLGSILCIITVLLVVEYVYFKQQAQLMMQMQTQYRAHMQTLRTITEDYAKAKERLMLLEELHNGEKKNSELKTPSNGTVSFPEGARVFSSDDNDPDAAASFNVVNRDLEYLKESTLAHIKEQDAASLLSRLDLEDWRDYTERLLERKKVVTKKTKPKPKVRYASEKQHSAITAGEKDMVISWPIDRSRFWLSSFFGPRKKKDGSKGFHYGIDMAAIKGTSVMAAAPGVVIESRYASGYGNTIVIAHNGKYKTRYAHLKSRFVEVGHKVRRGAIIGTVGDTGFVRSAFGRDPSHLHFELYAFGRAVNPMHFLT